ncbi:MAG: hypothetical protein P8074_21130 [Anaerolineales bacterium]|jgi:uncharacterized membrane protein
MAKIVIALYDDFNDAQQAIRELRQNGFERQDISLVANDVRGEYAQYIPQGQPAAEVAEGALEGAGIGAIVGALSGLLIGLSALALPGIGPVLVAGPLGATLAGTGIGAAAGSLLGALMEAGVPEEPAHYYAEGVRRGGSLVMVTTSEALKERTLDILNKHNPVEMQRRSEHWRAENWQTFDETAEPYSEEELEQKRQRYEQALDETRQELHQEHPSAFKKPDFEDYEPIFQNHYKEAYVTPDYSYEGFRPAYLYGFELGYKDRLADKEWEDIWPEARREWERQHPHSVWDDIKDAVRKGYDTVRARR